MVALTLRVGIIIATRHGYVPVADSLDYNRIARSISSGHGFGNTVLAPARGPSAFRPPLYPALLAAVYFVVGYHIVAARLFTAMVSTAFVPVLGALGWQLGGRRVGLVTVYLVAIYPPFIMAGYGLQYEVLYLTLVTLALLAALKWRDHPQRSWLLAAAGVCTGLTVLCRETGVLALLPIWALILQRSKSTSWRLVLGRGLGVTACAAIVVIPWTIRNAVTMHQFIPVSDSAGWAIGGQYNPTVASDNLDLWVIPDLDPSTVRRVDALGPSPTEPQLIGAVQAEGVSYIEAHPAFPLEVAWDNTVRMFCLRGFYDATIWAPYAPWPAWLLKLSALGFWIVGPLGALGLLTRYGRQVPRAIWLFPVFLYLVLAFTVADIEYRVELEPFFLLSAAMLLVTGYERWAGRAYEPPAFTAVRDEADPIHQ